MRQAPDKGGEGVPDASQIAVDVQVVGLDVGDHGDLGAQLQEGAVELVRLDDVDVRAARTKVAAPPGHLRRRPRRSGRFPPLRGRAWPSAVVVVLPWVPAIPATRPPLTHCPSASARFSTGIPASRAASSSG